MLRLSNQPRTDGIVVARVKGEPALFIAGRQVEVNQNVVLLIERLWQNVGRVVKYDDLCLILGRVRVGPEERHLLRQYILIIKKLLTEHRTSHVLTVASNLGYALCEIAG